MLAELEADEAADAVRAVERVGVARAEGDAVKVEQLEQHLRRGRGGGGGGTSVESGNRF